MSEQDTQNGQKNYLTNRVNVFVIMPFGTKGEYRDGGKESDHVFNEIICPAVVRAMRELGPDYEANTHREVDKNVSGSISDSILRSLVGADVVIADLTGENANVFFELGIRYSLRRSVTILLSRPQTVIPFDIQNYRHVKYEPLMCEQARNALAKSIGDSIRESRPDGPVFGAFRDLKVVLPGFSEKLESEGGDMPWEEYLNRIRWLGDRLLHAVENGSFAPDALIGISNGGLIVADILGRDYFRGTPVLGLWADRARRVTDSASWFFKNRYNDALMSAVRTQNEQSHQKDPPTILMVDDRIGSGQTAHQAIDYLREQLGGNVQVVFAPLVVSQPEYIKAVEGFLPCSYVDLQGRKVFGLTESELLDRLVTEAVRFPYTKRIRQ